MTAPSAAGSAPVVMTGGSGFVGQHLAAALAETGEQVRSLDRRALERAATGSGVEPLTGARAVVHLAARAHVLGETSGDLLETYRAVNRDLTLKLARAASRAGVRRFVFVSSVRVNGSASVRPFRPADPPRPDEPYAISKHEAELGLREIAAETGLEVVVIRPPLVYGPDVKANFRRLLQLAASGLPLPLGAVGGMRSLVGVRNLCDLLKVCVDHPAAPGGMFFASDGEDIALPSLIRELAIGMGRRPRLVPVPVPIVRGLAALAGQRATFDKLTASLQVDASETFATLGWRPPVPLREGLHETARLYLEGRA